MLRSQLTTSDRGGEYPNWNRNCSVRCGTIVPAVACRATTATDPRNKNTAAPKSRFPSDPTTIPPATGGLCSTSPSGYPSTRPLQTQAVVSSLEAEPGTDAAGYWESSSVSHLVSHC